MPRRRFIMLFLALTTLLVYLPVSQHGFVLYDDPDYITENPHVRAGLTFAGLKWAFTTQHASNWHPLTWLSHMLDCELFGLDPGAHHMVSALWHTGNALLLFGVLVRLTGAFWPSAWVAALFALHPLHVQSVAWAAERKDLLSTFFGLATIGCYAKWTNATRPDENRPWWFAAAVAAYCLSLLAKPMLVTLPFLLLLLDFWPLRRGAASPTPDSPGSTITPTRLIAEKLPFLVLALASSIVTYIAQRSEAVVALSPYPLSSRIANAALAYWRYLWKTIWPVDLAVIYPLQQKLPFTLAAIAGLALIAVSFAAWRFRTRKPHLFTGWFWYIGTLVPVIGIVQVGGQSMADRYTYVPLIGILIAIAFEVQNWLRHGTLPVKPVLVLATASVCASAAVTVWQLHFWRNSESLFARAIAVTGPNAVAEVNLGIALEQRNEQGQALQHYRKALRINPDLAQAHNNIANLLDAEGRSEEALAHYREAVRLKPASAMAHANLGSFLARAGRTDEAVPELAEAARLSPGDPRPHYLLAKAYMRANRGAEALHEFTQALRLDPDDVPSLVFGARTLALSAAGEGAQESVRWAQRAASLAGNKDIVLDTLAMAYAAAGQFPSAIRTQNELLSLDSIKADQRLLATARRKLEAYKAGQRWIGPLPEATEF